MSGILLFQFNPPTEDGEKFDERFDRVVVPFLLNLDGVNAVSHYVAIEGSPRSCVVVDYNIPSLFDIEVLAATEPLSGATVLCDCMSIDDFGDHSTTGDYIFIINMDVPEEKFDAIDDLYETEHSEALLRAHDWLRIRRFATAQKTGARWNRVTLHELANLEVMNSPERAQARQEPKILALSSEPWFQASYRWLGKRVSRVT